MMLEVNAKLFVNSSSFTITEDFRQILAKIIINFKYLEIREEWSGTTFGFYLWIYKDQAKFFF